MTRFGWWGVGLVAAWVVFAAGAFVVPEDSLVALVDVLGGFASAIAAAAVLPLAVFRSRDRSLSVYAAGFVLVVGVLLILLHPLYMND
jgi:hypothetical protein